MPTIISGQVGPQLIQDGVKGVEFRQGRTAELCVNMAHGRYYESTYRANVYTMSTAAAGVLLAAANASLTAATAQPVVGFLNPVGSGKNCSILHAVYTIQATGATTAQPGIPVYQVTQPSLAVASTSIAGTVPVNNFTLQTKGSITIGSLNQAYTGNGSTWVQLRPMVLPVAVVAAATSSINVNIGGGEYIDGSIMIPPGCAFGIFVLNAGTTATVGASVTWEEVPL